MCKLKRKNISEKSMEPFSKKRLKNNFIKCEDAKTTQSLKTSTLKNCNAEKSVAWSLKTREQVYFANIYFSWVWGRGNITVTTGCGQRDPWWLCGQEEGWEEEGDTDTEPGKKKPWWFDEEHRYRTSATLLLDLGRFHKNGQTGP